MKAFQGTQRERKSETGGLRGQSLPFERARVHTVRLGQALILHLSHDTSWATLSRRYGDMLAHFWAEP